MLFILLFATVLITLLVINKYVEISYDCESAVFVGIALSSICLFLAVILVPCLRYSNRLDILEFNSLKQTISNSRLKPDNLERVAFLQSIAEQNQWLVVIQDQNKSLWFDIYVPDEIEQLKPIE